MARFPTSRARAKRPSPGAARSETGAASERTPQLAPETRNGILAVVLFLVAALTALSLFGGAGVVGRSIGSGLRSLFGWGRVVVPLGFFVAGLVAFRRQTIRATRVAYSGLIVMALALLGFLHTFASAADGVVSAQQGNGGGWIGFLVSYPFLRAFGHVGAWVILIALFLIGALLFVNKSLRDLLRWKRPVSENTPPPVPVVTPTGEDAEPDAAEKKPSRFSFRRRSIRTSEQEESEEPAEPEEVAVHDEAEVAPAYVGPALATKRSDYVPPSLDLLESKSVKPTSGDVQANAAKIRDTLAHFDIAVEMADVHIGPTVTQYTLRPQEGMKLSKIIALHNDLALALAAHPIRIEAPIPGKSLVGIEVPNESVATVRLRDILASDGFQKHTSELPLAVGRDVAGHPYVTDLDRMPHLLIAGATGSGKSVAINTVLISLLFRNGPDAVKFILVDPKRVELSAYNGMPHLLTPVITEALQTVNALRWATLEMDKRYRLMSEAGVRNITGYNKQAGDQQLPYIVIVIDELADVMSVAAKSVEGLIVRLAQLARATGIHLILATQRPSVDVITGLIKANITARMAFSVASGTDSRTILDHSGAEKLLGRGDMLFITSELGKPKRLQGAFVTDDEVTRVTNYLKGLGSPDYNDDIVTPRRDASGAGASSGELGAAADGNAFGSDDPLYAEAKRVFMEAGKGSASLLQRRLKVGYARAARLLDMQEEAGIIGPGDGAKPREVLISRDGRTADDFFNKEE